MTPRLPPAPPSIEPTDVAQAERSLDLTRRFMRAGLASPALLDEIPGGATLALVPNDDPRRTQEEIGAGLLALRRGRDVYFTHVRLADLPAERGCHQD